MSPPSIRCSAVQCVAVLCNPLVYAGQVLSTVLDVANDDEARRFDPAGPELVYVQVADDIAGQIGRGELTRDARLPGEQDLADEYGVSKATARRAVRELRDRGLVRTVPYKGTYVI